MAPPRHTLVSSGLGGLGSEGRPPGNTLRPGVVSVAGGWLDPPPCRPLCNRALVLLTRLWGAGWSPPFSGPAPLLSGGAEPPLEVFLPLLFPTREKSHSGEAEGRWNAACRSMYSDPSGPVAPSCPQPGRAHLSLSRPRAPFPTADPARPTPHTGHSPPGPKPASPAVPSAPPSIPGVPG